MQKNINQLKRLFHQWSGQEPNSVSALPPSGSERKYFRLIGGGRSVIGAWNPVVEENEAFFSFTVHFHRNGLHVPAIYGIDKGRESYLIEDVGDTSLFSMLENIPAGKSFPEDLILLYQKSLKELIGFQVRAGKGVDYSKCYPHAAFDKRSMLSDLNYFKYYFLKIHVPFHEGRLEDDFIKLVDFLGTAAPDYFLYRDFQSRNIFIKDDQPYFIDYQGGRKGPLQYDVASLLFQVKANLPYELREELLDYYISELKKEIPVNDEEFRKFYYGFVLIRLLQVLGAYGFRGLIENKPHFIASIPYALKNIRWWLEHAASDFDLPELKTNLEEMVKLVQYQMAGPTSSEAKLTVTLKSFSYKKGFPGDDSGNGGGFVFDCRGLPNPGREERYMAFNGKDQAIIDYFRDNPAVNGFLDDAERMVSRSVENYMERGFKNIAVNFGCTGGQHRSVYCAETMAARLKEKFSQINVEILHTNIKF